MRVDPSALSTRTAAAHYEAPPRESRMSESSGCATLCLDARLDGRRGEPHEVRLNQARA